MNKWKIYYGDGSTFSDRDGNPWESPKVDIQVIVVRDTEVGKRMLFSKSYYIYKNGWLEVDDTTALVLHLLKDARIINTVRSGLFMHLDIFRSIMKTAKEDTYI